MTQNGEVTNTHGSLHRESRGTQGNTEKTDARAKNKRGKGKRGTGKTWSGNNDKE